jgi:hypothetical protein
MKIRFLDSLVRASAERPKHQHKGENRLFTNRKSWNLLVDR